MSTFSFDISGMSELRDALKRLPKTIEDDIVSKVARKTAKVVAQAVEAKAPRNTGKRRKPSVTPLAASVAVGDKKTISRRGKGSEVRLTKSSGVAYVGFKAKSNGRIAHIIEYGRQPGVSKKGRHYAGAPARPFIRPALEQSAGRAIEEGVNFARREIDKAAEQLAGPYRNLKSRTRKLLAK